MKRISGKFYWIIFALVFLEISRAEASEEGESNGYAISSITQSLGDEEGRLWAEKWISDAWAYVAKLQAGPKTQKARGEKFGENLSFEQVNKKVIDTSTQAGRIPSSHDKDKTKQLMNRWILRHYTTFQNFYEQNREELKVSTGIRVQVNDPTYFAELVELKLQHYKNAKLTPWTPEQNEDLYRLRYQEDPAAAYSAFVEEYKRPPRRLVKGVERTMANYAEFPTMGGGLKVFFHRLSPAAKEILLSRGFKTEKRKYSKATCTASVSALSGAATAASTTVPTHLLQNPSAHRALQSANP